MKKNFSVFLLSLVVVSLFSVSSAWADSRCGGRPGIQVWQDDKKGGPSFTACKGSHPTSTIAYPNLSNVTTNLSFGANWNDRITSYETFNFPSNKGIRLYDRDNYQLNQTTPPGHYITTMGNQYIPNVNVYWASSIPGGMNDIISSFKLVSN